MRTDLVLQIVNMPGLCHVGGTKASQFIILMLNITRVSRHRHRRIGKVRHGVLTGHLYTISKSYSPAGYCQDPPLTYRVLQVPSVRPAAPPDALPS